MADKAAAGAPAKLVLKPGKICEFLDNFNVTADKECFQYNAVNCSG